LFAMPNYVLLRDFSVTLYPAQSVGRVNPFLGIDESVVIDPAVPQAPVQQAQSGVGTAAVVNPEVPATGTSDSAIEQALFQNASNPTASQPETSPAQTVDESPALNQSAAVAPDPIQQAPQCDPLTDPTCFDFSAANALFGGPGGQ